MPVNDDRIKPINAGPMRRSVRCEVACLVFLATTALWATPTLAQVEDPDFNGDGYADLTVGVPYEDIGLVLDAGAVSVIYGSAVRLTDAGDQMWHQNKGGIRDSSEADDQFGASLTWGDYNGDGFSDLAVGVPGEDVGTIVNAGAVHVLFGSALGLSSTASQYWHQNISGVLDRAEAGDDFGYSLASGDFNGDGFTDLAIGSRGEDIGAKLGAGAVNVLLGSALGLAAAGNQFWSQDSLGILEVAEAGDNFGISLAAGDFDNDGFGDLAVGAHDEDIGAIAGAGAVNVLYGTAAGLSDAGNQLWTQDSVDVLDAPEPGDNLGFALIAGDFNGDGRMDLAIGVPDETTNAITASGAVNVLYGSSIGIRALGNQFWTQDSAGILDDLEDRDKFGHALGAGDFNGDGNDDLAVGVRDEDVGAISNAGAVNVIYGSAGGLTDLDNQLWYQGASGLPGTPDAGDNFGDGLTSGDYNGDGRADLAAAIHDEDVGNIVDAGAVQVIYGFTVGLRAIGNQLWNQNSPGIVDLCETADQFGSVVK